MVRKVQIIVRLAAGLNGLREVVNKYNFGDTINQVLEPPILQPASTLSLQKHDGSDPERFMIMITVANEAN